MKPVKLSPSAAKRFDKKFVQSCEKEVFNEIFVDYVVVGKPEDIKSFIAKEKELSKQEGIKEEKKRRKNQMSNAIIDVNIGDKKVSEHLKDYTGEAKPIT